MEFGESFLNPNFKAHVFCWYTSSWSDVPAWKHHLWLTYILNYIENSQYLVWLLNMRCYWSYKNGAGLAKELVRLPSNSESLCWHSFIVFSLFIFITFVVTWKQLFLQYAAFLFNLTFEISFLMIEGSECHKWQTTITVLLMQHFFHLVNFFSL